MSNRTCEVSACGRVHYARGLCNMHYQRWKAHGDPIRGHRTPDERFWSKVHKTDDCWLWTAAKANFGYGTFWDGRRLVHAHRYSYERAHGSLPKGMSVLHRCDVPACVNPSHLFLGTQRDNMEDMADKNRKAVGDARAHKLTSEDVREIRRRAETESQSSIARLFGVSPIMVSMIVRRERWGHLD